MFCSDCIHYLVCADLRDVKDWLMKCSTGDIDTHCEDFHARQPEILYICNQKKCDECHPEYCQLTTDVSFAKNFEYKEYRLKPEGPVYKKYYEEKTLIMAAIDHTVIVFKNGKWMKETWKYNADNDDFVSLVPFGYGRDGNIYSYHLGEKSVPISDKMKWYRNEYDALYQRVGLQKIYGGLRNCTISAIWNRIKWMLHVMERKCFFEYEKEIGVYEDENVEVYIYHEPLKQSYVSFYREKEDTYIVLGGYGHYKNVYCHFMNRGYGDEFEEKMAKGALTWCMTSVVDYITDALYPDDMYECDEAADEFRRAFLGDSELDYYV